MCTKHCWSGILVGHPNQCRAENVRELRRRLAEQRREEIVTAATGGGVEAVAVVVVVFVALVTVVTFRVDVSVLQSRRGPFTPNNGALPYGISHRLTNLRASFCRCHGHPFVVTIPFHKPSTRVEHLIRDPPNDCRPGCLRFLVPVPVDLSFNKTTEALIAKMREDGFAFSTQDIVRTYCHAFLRLVL